ncbi:MAG: tetratricopeptide repeat protein [Flavobacteriales bacterium]
MKNSFKISLQIIAFSVLSVSATFAQTLKEVIKFTDNEQFESAQAAFGKLIKAEPANSNNYFYLGENFFGMEILDSAKMTYQKGIEIDPENALNYVGLGKVQWYQEDAAAKENFAKAIALSKSKNATVLYKIAEVYIKAPKQNLPEAFILLNNAAKLEPKNPEIYILMGDAFLEQENGSQAIVYYEKATTLDPNSTKALLRTGKLYGRAQNFQLAFEYYEKANAIDSSFAPAYREKAEFYYKDKKLDKAIAQYQKYLQLNDNLSARVRYASFLFLSKQYPRAISEIQEIQKRDTSRVALYRLLAYSYYETGDYAAGMANMDKFFQKADNDKVKVAVTDYKYQGRLLSKTNQDSLAIISLNKAVAMDSTDAELYMELGTLYYRNKQYPQAISALEKRIVLQKGASPNDFNALGRAYFYNKDYAKSDSIFAKIVAAKPDLPLGYLWRARSMANLDPDSKLGLAKPHYEAFIQKAEVDVQKNKKDLVDAYSYIAYYSYMHNDLPNARLYYKKVLELDPENANAKTFMKEVK